MIKKSFALLLALLFFMSGSQAYGQTSGSAGSASNAATSDTVATAGELIEWLKSHYATGGRVTLTDNLFFSGKGVNFSLEPGQDLSVYVDMQGFSITVSGTIGLYINEGFHFYGEGVTSPLFMLNDFSRLTLCEASITALGNEYYGGCAVSLARNAAFTSSGGRVQSYGANAVAVLGQGRHDIKRSYVEACGDGAVAISGTVKLNAFLSVVSGSALALSTTLSEEYLDTCVIYPETDKVQQITRRYSFPTNEQTQTLEVALNDPAQVISSADTRSIYLINVNDLNDDRRTSVQVEWEPIVPGTSELGETTISGRLRLEQLCPVEIFEMLAKQEGVDTLDTAVYLTIKVIEPYKPEVLETEYNGNRLSIYLRHNINKNFITVLLTDDLGETWKDITSEVMLTGGSLISIWDLLPDTIYGFTIIAAGSGLVQGASDILAVRLNNVSMEVEDVDPSLLNGGDRGGTSAEPQTDNRNQDSNNDSNNNNRESNEKSEPSIAKDREDSDKLSLSWTGSRLKDQITANPETVTFIKDGVKVDISSKALLNLNISDYQLFNILIAKPANDQFIVEISQDEIPIISLPLRVSVDYKPDASAKIDCLVVVNEKGQVVPLSGFNNQTGKIIAQLDQPGSYKIVEKKPTAFADTSSYLSVSLNFLSVRGIVNGYPDGKFKPAEPMSNGQFIAMLARVFSDVLPVSDGKWYEPHKNWAVQAGLASNSVNPEKPLTAWEAQQYFNGLTVYLGLESAPGYGIDSITASVTRLQGVAMLSDFIKSIL